MREFEIPTSKPKLRLLDAAQAQVAAKGFDAVSVRDVTEKAKANVAAVNYHFGSREGLMALVMARCLVPVQKERLDRLTVLEKKCGAKGAPVEEVLEAFLRPLFVIGGRSGVEIQALLARILGLLPDQLPPLLQESMAELWQRYLKALGKSLPEFSRQELAWKLHGVSAAAIGMLAGDEPVQRWAGVGIDPEIPEQRGTRLLRWAIALMREGSDAGDQPAQRKGPQATFDF